MDGRKKEQWSSRIGFVLSSAGAAIGLGAIWKFPYVTGMSGGGAFLLIFIAFTILIGLPMLISEFIIGRGAEKEAISAYKKLAPDTLWIWVGRLGVIGCFLLLSFYSVVGGWVLIYTGLSIPGMIIKDGANYSELFEAIISNHMTTFLGLALFLLINVIVVSFGIQNGIERANKYLMPLLFIFFIVLVVRSLTLERAMEGVRFFLTPSFENITSEAILYALGQSFFALAVGFSCMVTYSSYLSKDVSIPSSAGWVVIMNIFVSVLAGLAIFPAVFSFGLEPAEGPGLLFIVLPTVFSKMPFGELFFSMFLLLFLFATLTSSFSLLEIIVSAFTANGNRSRQAVSWVSGLIVFIAGIPAALSFSSLADFQIFGKTVFDATDYLVSNLLLPIGNLLIALFIIHKMDETLVKQEFLLTGNFSPSLYTTWRWLMKWLVPIGIVIVFINLVTNS
ncbi:neurotransmitter:Na+ symporter, NSS family [Aneurinibacillus thermoaerophilus]|uniref:Transporter n=1 Tax=Aneurinibacillus thermoaerophilus TaxID=143495 RepID=A0A1G7YXQ4_ANETH|nr:sodium-dependent transporter [Aneurinibacillus thermoaerophilus]SDH01046.1 neurotransmitter:Na+ symporter, NSS family [Aneurinibacillus thermoaerophilus]